MPQQQMHTAQIVLHFLAETVVEYQHHGEFQARDHWDFINNVIDTRFPGLCCADYSDYTAYDQALTLVVKGWASVTCQLPFPMTTALSSDQIDAAIAVATRKAVENKPWGIPDEMVEAAWVVVDHEPDISLLDLASVTLGTKTMRQYYDACRSQRRFVPKRLIAPRPQPVFVER
jgi:hypothetical protein